MNRTQIYKNTMANLKSHKKESGNNLSFKNYNN